MTKNVTLTLTEDEAEMLVDALEVDMDGYVEAAKEARVKGNKEDLTTFTEAAQRVQALMTRIQELIED